ncbi:Bactoprenol glucosyl transferase-like protein from prophage CPS-53 [Candidatus Electrothrix gigas]
MTEDTIIISIVCPFYNEEEVVDFFMKEIAEVMNDIKKKYEIICVNDGSTDNTLKKLIQAKEKYPMVRVINLSRNFGKEAALTAGLDHAQGEAIIPIDADLQDPPEIIKEFVLHWEKGFRHRCRKENYRLSDSFAKRISHFFYKINTIISDTAIPSNVGDYRLITKKVLKAMQQLPENQRFMKGLFAWAGFKTTVVEYKRNCKKAGKTSFHGWKLWNFALDGITSFSTVPIKVWLYIGAIISLLSFSYGSFIII